MKLGKHFIILIFAFGAFIPLAASASSRPTHRAHSINHLSQSSEAATTARHFEIQKLAEGVYGVIRKDLPGLMVDANNVFIINDEDVIVIDSNGAPAITKEVLAALRKLTNKPVKYVINTHYHDDHIRGNQVYREAFPGVEFIGHEFSRQYLPGQGATNRQGFLTGAPGFANQMRDFLRNNKSPAGGELSAEERLSMESDLRLIDLVLSEGAQAKTVLPTITVKERLTLHRGERVIEVLHLGSGHTAADLVVHLPNEGIVITGDLVVAPIPLVGNPQSHIGAWASTLEKLCELHPKIIVPGHGAVMRDDLYVKQLAKLFTTIKEQTAAAAARGETLEQARKSINLDDLRKLFTGASPVRKIAFNMYVTGPAIAAAFREATAKP